MIELRSASLRASVLPLGASLAGFWHQSHAHSLVLGAPDPQTYRSHLAYFGALVGPIANRVGGAKIRVDDKTWKLDANENSTSLHGGRDGLSELIWNVIEASDRTVKMAVTLAHGAGGLPGNRQFSATYHLADTGTLRLEITASTDVTTAVNIAHHPYWNLDNSDTTASHQLMVPAETYLPVDDANLPIGVPAPVAGTVYDFRMPRHVPTDVPIDANLCLGTKRHSEPTTCATLTGKNGLQLEIRSTETGLQVYNGFGLAEEPVELHDGRELCACAGLALEPQAWPDAPNHAHFPSILLPANETYRQVTEYLISE